MAFVAYCKEEAGELWFHMALLIALDKTSMVYFFIDLCRILNPAVAHDGIDRPALKHTLQRTALISVLFVLQ